MKKIYLSIFSLACFSSINAQFSLTKNTNEPGVGDVYNIKNLDSNAVALPITIVGQNVTWNVTSIFETNNVSTSMYTTNGGNASNFSGTTIVQEDQVNGNFSYYKSTPTSFELLGAEITFSGLNAELNYNTNSAIVAQYPIAFGYNVSDAIGGTITASGSSGPFTGTIKNTADGTGTLNINGTTLTNCLRVKTVQQMSFTLAFGFVSGTLDQVIYNYYNNTNKFPLFTISYGHVQTTGAQTINQKVATITSLASVPVGIKENKLNDIIFKAYPNPANNEVNIHFVLTQNETYTIDIVNTLGQTVRSLAKPNLQPGMYSENISLDGLSAGIYHINVKGKNTKGVEKLVIQ